MSGIGDWSGLYRHRQAVRSLYPSIWKVPVVKKELDRLLPNVRQGGRVLELGAGDRRFEMKIRAARQGVEYRSMDIDRSTYQDYYSIEDVEGRYDLVFMFELIEHLTPEEGLLLLGRVKELLSEDGRVLIGTPNLYHPHRYFGDITHKTPYKYEELGALMLLAGFAGPSIYRVYNDALLRRAFRLSIGLWLHRYLDIDFAGSILAEAGVARSTVEAGA